MGFTFFQLKNQKKDISMTVSMTFKMTFKMTSKMTSKMTCQMTFQNFQNDFHNNFLLNDFKWLQMTFQIIFQMLFQMTFQMKRQSTIVWINSINQSTLDSWFLDHSIPFKTPLFELDSKVLLPVGILVETLYFKNTLKSQNCWFEKS